MNLAEILDQFEAGAETHRIAIPANWLQGRTSYGGLSSALAYQTAKLVGDDLPPLKSGQVAFVGPVAGEVEIRASLLRRGRNSAFVRSEIIAEGKNGPETALSCSFVFMHGRDSHVDYADLEKPEFDDWPKDDALRSGPPEFFTNNMHYVGKRLELGRGTPRMHGWQRLIEREGLDPMAELVCISDALPPSAMGLMTEAGMVSSINWQFNILSETPETREGWWHLESHTHHARNGASSQFMSVWNADGEPMMTGMQSVAIFS